MTLSVDLALLDRLLAGDRGAVAPFVEALTPIFQSEAGRLLYRTGQALGRDARQEVEDLVHDLFLGLVENDWQELRGWRPDGGRSLPNYLRQYARFRLISLLRTRRHNPWQATPTEPQELERRAGAAGGKEEPLASRQLLDRILQVLAVELTEEEIALFRAFFIEERELIEVSQETGLTVGTLYKRKSRMLARLRLLREQALADISPALAPQGPTLAAPLADKK